MKKKPFTDGDIIEEEVVEAMTECLETMISLAPNTVARRTENLGNNIAQQIVGKAQCFSR
jgi:hypothetical protein